MDGPLTCPKGHALRLIHGGGYMAGNTTNVICVAGAQCYEFEPDWEQYDLYPKFYINDAYDKRDDAPLMKPGQVLTCIWCWACATTEEDMIKHVKTHVNEDYDEDAVMGFVGVTDWKVS